MNLLFDNIIFSKEKQGGISNYWFEIIKNYFDKNNAHFYEEKSAITNIFRRSINLKNIVSHTDLPISLARMLPIHYTANTDTLLYHSSFYRKLITRSKVCEVSTIHDFLHQKHSSTPINKLVHNTLKFGSIKRSQGIICVSRNTLLDLKKYCPPNKNQKVEVIYNGVSDDYKKIITDENNLKLFTTIGLNDKFLLFVGARSKYKNFAFVIELLHNLPEFKLVVVGYLLSEVEKSNIDKSLLNRIIVCDSISNNELNILYNYAHALLYPSFYEGFGFPVVEAMKAGCPVLALNMTSIPEIAGGAAILFDKLDVPGFVKAIKLVQNPEEKARVAEAGFINAKRFNWEKCVKETAEFYDDIYSSFN